MPKGHDTTTLVLIGAAQPSRNLVAGRSFSQVIGVDKGIDYALQLGLKLDVCIGDFDSVSPQGLAAAEASGARIDRHPERKDCTDLELGLDEAIRLGAPEILVVGAYDTTRLDHQLANLLLLGHPKYFGASVEARIGSARLHVLTKSVQVQAVIGETVTLLAINGDATGVTTTGLEYPLESESLMAASSRGVSNIATSSTVGIDVTSGTLLLIFPGDH